MLVVEKGVCGLKVGAVSKAKAGLKGVEGVGG